jgi:hypothetical protein
MIDSDSSGEARVGKMSSISSSSKKSSKKGRETSSAAATTVAGQRRRSDGPVGKQKAPPAESVMSLERLEACKAFPYLGAVSNAAANSELTEKLRKIDAMGYGEFVRGDPGARKLSLDPEAGYGNAETTVKKTFLDATAAANDTAAADGAGSAGRRTTTTTTNTFRTDLASELRHRGFDDEEVLCVLTSFGEDHDDDEAGNGAGGLSTAAASKQRESAFKVYAIPTKRLFKACLARGGQKATGRSRGGGGGGVIDLPISSAYLASLA